MTNENKHLIQFKKRHGTKPLCNNPKCMCRGGTRDYHALANVFPKKRTSK